MANPSDIGVNAPSLKPYPVRGVLATTTGILYGTVVSWDNGTNNFRDVKLATALKETGLAGVCTTKEARGVVGEAIEIAINGAIVEVLLDTSAVAAKGGEAIAAANDGNCTPIASNTGAMDVLGRFMQNATAPGTGPIYASLQVGIYTKTVA